MEVGHVPVVLLVIVVVGIGAVVTGSNTLSIRSRSSVVEIGSSLVAHLSSWSKSHLLLLLWSGGSNTNHPDQQNQKDEEDDSSSNSSSNVGKLGLCFTIIASE